MCVLSEGLLASCANSHVATYLIITISSFLTYTAPVYPAVLMGTLHESVLGLQLQDLCIHETYNSGRCGYCEYNGPCIVHYFKQFGSVEARI